MVTEIVHESLMVAEAIKFQPRQELPGSRPLA